MRKDSSLITLADVLAMWRSDVMNRASPNWFNWCWDDWIPTGYVGRWVKCLLFWKFSWRELASEAWEVWQTQKAEWRTHVNNVGQWRGTRERKKGRSRSINKANDVGINMTKISLYHHWVVKSEHRKRRKFTMETSGYFERVGVLYCLVWPRHYFRCIRNYLSQCQSRVTWGVLMGSSQRRFQRNSFKLSRFHMPENRSWYNIALRLWQQ